MNSPKPHGCALCGALNGHSSICPKRGSFQGGFRGVDGYFDPQIKAYNKRRRAERLAVLPEHERS